MISFETEEKRDALARDLAQIAKDIQVAISQGGDHTIGVSQRMAEDILLAALIVKMAPVGGLEPPTA